MLITNVFQVYPNAPKAVIFDIRPIKLGLVTLSVTAQPEAKTNEKGDIETREVLVKVRYGLCYPY